MKPVPMRNSFLVAALAMSFWWAFQFAKHNPLLRNIIPFGEDPYDAVSSFGAITVVLLAFVSVMRSCWPSRVGRSGRLIYVLRVQAAIPFCILVTIAAEAVAMVRHSSMWMNTSGSARLVTLLVVFAGLSIAALALLRGNGFQNRLLLVQAVVVWLATLFALALYPERLILQMSGHLLTVVLGAVFLFAPLSALVKAWLPETPSAVTSNRARERVMPPFTGFAVAVAVGSLIGALAFLAEAGEDATWDAALHLLFVGSVFVGLGASGMAIGYLFLGRLLGFAVGEPSA